MSHCIRLRAGWIRQIGSQEIKVDLPDELAGHLSQTFRPSPGEAGVDGLRETTTHYRRPFNCPSGLDAGGSEADGRVPVDLVVEGWSGRLAARFDDELLCESLPPSAAPLRISVTDRLHGHHQLKIDLTPLESQDSNCRLTGIVFLEIHA